MESCLLLKNEMIIALKILEKESFWNIGNFNHFLRMALINILFSAS